MADLATVKPSEVLHKIVHPSTGKYIGVTVTLVSITDERLKPLIRQIQDNRYRLEARGKNFKAEEVENNGLEIATRAMTGWTWEKDEDGDEATFHGKKPEFNPATVKAVLTELPWFKSQIDVKISEEKDFFHG